MHPRLREAGTRALSLTLSHAAHDCCPLNELENQLWRLSTSFPFGCYPCNEPMSFCDASSDFSLGLHTCHLLVQLAVRFSQRYE